MVFASLFPGSGLLKAQDKADDQVAVVGKISDSVVIVLARAIAHKDSVLLASIFPENINVLMPGRIPHRGKASLMKNCSVLFDRVGGWKLATTRNTLDLVKGMGNLIRETGVYMMVEPSEKTGVKKVTGKYLANWRLDDNKWVLHNLLLSKD